MPANVRTYGRNDPDLPGGIPYEEWTVRWWRWLLASNPPDFLGGFDVDQLVNFIGGTYEQDAVLPGPIRSRGTPQQPLPIGKSILAAISVANISALEHPAILGALPAQGILDDAHEIMDGDNPNNRPVAGTFTVHDPNGNTKSFDIHDGECQRIEHNALQNLGFAAGIIPGQPANANVPCALAGHWIFLRPLTLPGLYTIEVSGMAPRYGTNNQIFQTAATYHLIVG